MKAKNLSKKFRICSINPNNNKFRQKKINKIKML